MSKLETKAHVEREERRSDDGSDNEPAMVAGIIQNPLRVRLTFFCPFII